MPIKNSFRQNCKGKQNSQLNAKYGDYRKQGIFKGMQVPDAPAMQSFGPGKLDILGFQDFHHFSSNQTDKKRQHNR